MNAPTHWIEIELVGEDDRPIPWEEYQVVLPDGTVVRGYLDDEGYARCDRIAQGGQCRVSFPALDRDAWQDLATLPEKAAAAAV